MTPTSIKLPMELKEKIRKKAKQENRTLHGYLINLLLKLHK